MLKKLPILLLISVSLSACANNSNEKKMETALIDYNNPKSICYGRLNITVPKETEISYGLSSYENIDLVLDPEVNSLQKYQEFIKNTINELKSSKHETEPSLFQHDIKIVANGAESHIIVFRKNFDSVSMYQIYGYMYLPLKKKMLIMQGGAANGYTTSGIDDVKNLILNTKFTKTDKPSTCYSDFYVEDYDETARFFSEVYFTFPSYPEVRVNIDNRSRLTSDDGLIKFAEANWANLPVDDKASVNVEKINVGSKKIDLMEGEEYSHHISSKLSFNRGYEDIVWQHLGELDKVKKSYVKFDLSSQNQNGGDSNALVDQKAVIQLGHYILNNLKNNDR